MTFPFLPTQPTPEETPSPEAQTQEQQGMQRYMPTSYMQQNPELTKWTLDPNEILSDLQHDLRGEMYDKRRRMWIQVGDRLLNDKGINTIISHCKTIINKNAFLSNLDDAYIHEIVLDLTNNLTILLFVNYDGWDIDPAKAYMNQIIEKTRVYMFLGLRRALNESEKKFISRIESIHRNITEQPQQKKKFGIF
jgi:hypothetical protein